MFLFKKKKGTILKGLFKMTAAFERNILSKLYELHR